MKISRRCSGWAVSFSRRKYFIQFTLSHAHIQRDIRDDSGAAENSNSKTKKRVEVGSGEREMILMMSLIIYIIDGLCVLDNYHFWRYFHALNLLHLDLHLHCRSSRKFAFILRRTISRRTSSSCCCSLFLFASLAESELCRDCLRPRSQANHARSRCHCLHQYFYLLFSWWWIRWFPRRESKKENLLTNFPQWIAEISRLLQLLGCAKYLKIEFTREISTIYRLS